MMMGEKSFTAMGQMRKASYSTLCQRVLEAWNTVPNTAIIYDFIKANIVDAPLPDKVPPPDPARSADDLPLALSTLLHSESVEADFIGFSDIKD